MSRSFSLPFGLKFDLRPPFPSFLQGLGLLLRYFAECFPFSNLLYSGTVKLFGQYYGPAIKLNVHLQVIGSESVDSRAMEFFRPRIEQICPVLMQHAMCAEEGTRNVVSECLGKLCLVYPEYLLPRLKVNDFVTNSSVLFAKLLDFIYIYVLLPSLQNFFWENLDI